MKMSENENLGKRCLNCGRYIGCDRYIDEGLLGWYDRVNRNDDESEIGIFCDQDCADEYHEKQTHGIYYTLP